MDMAENTGASQSGPCNTQPSPMESSQLVSGQSSVMSTWKQTVMASASCSTHETACTPNSTGHPGKAIDFRFGEPGETASVNQNVMSAEQKKSLPGPQHMHLSSTPKTCLPQSQKTAAVLDTTETLYNEGYWMRTLNSEETLLIQNKATCESQITFGNQQIALSGSQSGQDPNVDHFLVSEYDQNLSGDLEMPFSGDQTSYYSQMTTRNGEHLTLYGSQTTAPSSSQAPQPNQILTSFPEQNPVGDQQRNLVTDNRSYGDQMIPPNGYQAFYEPQMRDNRDQIKHYQMTSFSGQNVCRGQENLFRGDHSLSGYLTSGYRYDQDLIVNHQVTSPIGDQPLYDFQEPTSSFDVILHGTNRTTSSAEGNLAWHPETSRSSEETFYLSQMRTSVNQSPSQNGTPNIEESLDPQVTSLSSQAPDVGESSYPSSSPLMQRQPQESSSHSGLIQGQHPEMKLDLNTQNPVSQKKPHPSKRYCCPYQGCKKSYTRSQHLRDHMRKHTDDKPYACDKPKCEWRFYRLGDLKRHKQKHSGLRPYSCPKCNRSYSRLPYLNQHLRSHNEATPTNAT